ncbi:hypothetical protein ACX1C1_21500 [Paenibacillus sp. strain BS8-2]
MKAFIVKVRKKSDRKGDVLTFWVLETVPDIDDQELYKCIEQRGKFPNGEERLGNGNYRLLSSEEDAWEVYYLLGDSYSVGSLTIFAQQVMNQSYDQQYKNFCDELVNKYRAKKL